MKTAKFTILCVVRLLSNIKIYLSILIGILILLDEQLFFLLSMQSFNKEVAISFTSILTQCLSYSAFPFLFPLICTHVSCLGFCEDEENNFFQLVCLKISKQRYINGKYISSILVGGGVCALTILLTSLVLALFYSGNLIHVFIGQYNNWNSVFKIFIAYFFAGMAVSGIGNACSALTLNKYVVIFLPLLLFNIVEYITKFFGWNITPLNLLYTYGKSCTLEQSIVLFSIIAYISYELFKLFINRRVGV